MLPKRYQFNANDIYIEFESNRTGAILWAQVLDYYRLFGQEFDESVVRAQPLYTFLKIILEFCVNKFSVEIVFLFDSRNHRLG